LLFLLSALAIDGAATFLAQRELADACAGAANDAAAAGLDIGRLYRAGSAATQEVDPNRAETIARSRVAPLEARWKRPVTIWNEVDGPKVALRLEADVKPPIGPGGAARAHVSATCSATTVRR